MGRGYYPDPCTKEFSLAYIDRICQSIQDVPVTVFAKDAWYALPDMNDLDCNTIGLDWLMDPISTRALLPSKTLQGNLDPCVLYADEDKILKETERMLEAFGDHPHIANLGHGVYPDTDPEKVKIFIEAVKSLSR